MSDKDHRYPEAQNGEEASPEFAAIFRMDGRDYGLVELREAERRSAFDKGDVVGSLESEGRVYWVCRMDGGETGADELSELLTARELQVACLVAKGCPNKQIAHRLRISEWTVATYLRRIFAKLGVDSRAAMTFRCASLIEGQQKNSRIFQ